MKVTTWKNCYDAQWSGIVPEAYAHPAKYSPGLIQKIYAYGLEQGWFKPGDVVADCFGGIGGGGIFAAYARLKWVGVELEARFVDLATRNFDLHRATWQAHGYPEPVIIQGDSRRFSEIIGKCDAITTSPPFLDSVPQQDKNFCAPHDSTGYLKGDYGQTPGQIGNLRVDSIVTSPPYATAQEGAGIAITGTPEMRKTGGGPSGTGGYRMDAQGQTPGQIGNEKGMTYWSEMAKIYKECHKALKPGGYLIVVVKSYIKNKRKVPLPQQTLKLLINLGFEPIERIKAMLVKQSVNCGLFGEDVVTEKSRKSFFRRLCEKNGSPRIDWEEVLVLRK